MESETFGLIDNLEHANVIGDLHAYAMFESGLFESAGKGTMVRVEIVSVTGLMASTFDTAMPDFLQKLSEQQMLVRRRTIDDEPLIGPHDRNSARPTLFFNAEGHLRKIFLPQVCNYDYVIEGLAPDAQPAVLQHLTPIAYEQVRTFAWQLLQPYLAGVQSLIQIGMKRLAIHGLPPPDRDDERFAATNGYRADRDSRYKGALLFNSILRDWCSLENVVFVDIWSDVVAADGYLDARYSLDGTHLNDAAAALSLSQLFARQTSYEGAI